MVVTTVGAHVKVATVEMVGGYAPQVALTLYVPVTQAVDPPATKSNSNAPDVALTTTFPTSTSVLLGLITFTKTAVLGPGAGVTELVTLTGWAPT